MMQTLTAAKLDTSTKRDGPPEAFSKHLEKLATHVPEMAEPAAFYRAALPMLRAAESGIEPFCLPSETVRRKLGSGQPLLVGEDLPLDVEANQNLFLNLCHILERLPATGDAKAKGGKWSFHPIGRRQSDEQAERCRSARQIRRAVEQDELQLAEVWQALALGNWRRMELIAMDLELEPDILYLLAQNSLKPALRVWANELSQSVNLEQWQCGYCPMCGSLPVLAEIQGKEGARHLRCGLCGTGWPYPRLKCAFCASANYKSLGYISVEGEEEKYRLQTCEACRGYLKVVITYDSLSVDLLPLEDLATLHLDLIAVERQYARSGANTLASARVNDEW
jgi:FdhE protein